MKKTLIALVVAATAFSGVAMADWQENGVGGVVDMTGTLTPSTVGSVWEVFVGGAVSNLNADVAAGQQEVSISVESVIPVLGIRTKSSELFQGGMVGIVPQISFGDGNAIDIGNFSDGKTELTLSVVDASNVSRVIGSLTTQLSAVAERSYYVIENNEVSHADGLYAQSEGDAFYGGLSSTASGAISVFDGVNLASELVPGVTDNYVRSAMVGDNNVKVTFADDSVYLSAYYASGIRVGDTIAIKLDEGVSGNAAIEWRASLPVTVTYL